MSARTEEIATPLGPMRLVSGPTGVRSLEFLEDRMSEARVADTSAGSETESDHARRVREFFGGALDALDSIPVDPEGTPFQHRVWAELRRIPVGATASYGAIAQAIGRPGAARAIGTANHANPVAVIVPCHRVIGSDGSLTGYGGGLDRKRWLLEHESADGARRPGAEAGQKALDFPPDGRTIARG